MKLKEHLEQIGFEMDGVSYRYTNHSYLVTECPVDSDGFQIYLIENLRFNDRVFRGRILNGEMFDQIFLLVREDYDLMPSEVEKLKQSGSSVG